MDRLPPEPCWSSTLIAYQSGAALEALINMDDSQERLNEYINASTSACAVLRQIHGLDLDASDIQSALIDLLEIQEDSLFRLLDYRLTETEIIVKLKCYDFKQHKPEILAEFTEREPLIPSGIPRLLTERTVKVKGEIWRVHTNDADGFPSIPHAHNYETGVVLDLGNGAMYDRNRNQIRKLSCKKLLLIRGKLTGIHLPATPCERSLQDPRLDRSTSAF
ncbi:hypothetical protein KQ298_11170 [Synechococcus sp. CS-1330]|nr:hypothetical protein [Synechococcus sp. CS-1330]